MTTEKALERLETFDMALEHCDGLPELKNEAGRLSVGLAEKARHADNKPLVRRLVSKLNDTPYVAQISAAAGLNEPEQSSWDLSYVIGIPAALIVLGALAFMFARKPLLRPTVYENIPEDAKFSIAEQEVPARWALKHILRPHKEPVLDAWVKEHPAAAMENYMSKCERGRSFDGQLTLGSKSFTSLRPEDLHAVFSKNQVRLLVTGKDPAANSRLACQLGWWSMMERPGDRPCRNHPMLPVLIDNRVDFEDGEDTFLEVINERLRVLTDLDDDVPRDQLQQLLMRRRVLVIVDGFSEMSEPQRRWMLDSVMKHRVNACVISSTSDDIWDSLPRHVIRLATS